MPRRFQFNLRTLLIAVLCAGLFCAGVQFERELQRQADEAARIAAEKAAIAEAQALLAKATVRIGRPERNKRQIQSVQQQAIMTQEAIDALRAAFSSSDRRAVGQ